jgi:hypothetical protein
MSITRTGKIGRLPKCIRDMLGQRIEDGGLGKEIVKWLNGLSGVQRVLEEQFDGRPITEQNLSEWKQHGHPEWLRQEEKRSLISSLTDQSDDLDEAADGHEISDRFANVMAAELIQLGTTLLEKETDPEKRWQRFRDVHRELSQLRSDDHRAVRMFIKRQNWIRRTEREDEEAEKRSEKEERKRLCAPFWAQIRLNTMAELFGGGESGRLIAATILEIENGLPLGTLGGKPVGNPTKSSSAKPNPTESKPIQPNPT